MRDKENEIFIDSFTTDDSKIYDVSLLFSSLFSLFLSEDKRITLIIDEKQQSND